MPHKRIDVGPSDRLHRKAGSAPRAQPTKHVPEIDQRIGQRRRGELGLVLGAALVVFGALDQALEQLAITDAVGVDRVELERFFGERPQAIAEGRIKLISSCRYSITWV